MRDPARERTLSTTAATAKSSNSSRQGIQLLSPTLQQSIAARSSADNSLASSRVASSSRTDRVASFDFDSFTLESVRATSICSNNAAKCDKPTISNNNANHAHERVRNASSLPHHEYAVPRAKSTHSAVRMSGWLQRRKGVMLRRWKAYFCVLRRDDQLCLYASEDTVNGRLERRVQVLRVLLTDASDVFHVIGVGADGAPRKDEFRATHSVDWRDWFLGFRDLLDAVSLQGALARKPELALLPSPSCLQQRSTSSFRSRGSIDDDAAGYRLRGSIDDDAAGYRLRGSMDDAADSGGQQRVLSYAHERRSALHAKPETRESLDKYPESDHFGARSTMSAFSVASTNQSSSSDGSSASLSDCPIPETSRGSGSTARSFDISIVKASAFSW